MAAINVIRQNQAVHILSDGAFCDATGIVCEIGPNAFALPHLPAALAIRGSSHFMPFLVHRLSRECRSFDDMLPKIVPAALEVHVVVSYGVRNAWLWCNGTRFRHCRRGLVEKPRCTGEAT